MTAPIYIFSTIGAWRSLVAHLLWEQGVGGSNPLAPTNSKISNFHRNIIVCNRSIVCGFLFSIETTEIIIVIDPLLVSRQVLIQPL